MSDVELGLKVNGNEFLARGPQDWVAEQRDHFLGRLAHRHVEAPTQDDQSNGEQQDRPFEVTRWLGQHELSDEQIDQVFRRGPSGWKPIVSKAPGSGMKEQAINIYLLTAFAQFLETGQVVFDDNQARSYCKEYACYSERHHAEYIDSAKKWVVRSKERSWELTRPGQLAAAVLIKQIAGS